MEIPIFVGGYGIAFYEETARQFEALRPGLKVNLHGDPRMSDKMRIRAIAGDLPAATATDLLWPSLIRAGKVIDLTPYLDGPNWEGDTRWGDTFRAGALETWRMEGGTYGLPFSQAFWTIFYNQGLFRQHGWKTPHTWEEFFQLAGRMRAAGVAPLALPGVYLRYADALLNAAYYNLAGAEGWRAYRNLNPGARSDSRFIRAAGVLQQILREDLVSGWEGMTHTSAQLAFLEGRSAMVLSGSWLVNEMKGKIPDDFELGVMAMPVFSDGAGDPTAVQTGSDYFFLFASGDPESTRLTVDFFRYLTSRERAQAFASAVDTPVALRGVPASVYSARARASAELIEGARESYSAPPNMLQPPGLNLVMTEARYQLATGRISPEQFGAQLEEEAAAARARSAEPDRVQLRHPWAGAALLAALVAATVWLVGRWRSRVAAGGERVAGGYFSTLRLPVAAGFIGPALILFAGLVLLPGLASFAGAFLTWDGVGAIQWAGLFNFKWLILESDAFWVALGNNLFLMIVPTLVVVPLALFFACLIQRGVWGAGFFRAVFLFPNVLGGIAATLLWMSAYEPHHGIVNAGLVALGQGFDSDWLRAFANHAWLSQANLYRSLIPIYIWMACGFNLILYLAAMQGIDPQLYEAAEMDGASPARQFFTITLPLIREVLVISAVFIVIGGLNAFEMIWLLTSQDPATGSHTLGTLMVSTMFKDFQIGRATAIAVVMFCFVFIGSAMVMRGLGREEVDS